MAPPRKGEIMGKWNLVHDEAMGSADRTLSIWSDPNGPGVRVIFEVNEEGSRVKYYQTARDAVLGLFVISDVCYGENVMTWEEGKFDGFLDKVWENQDSVVILGCEHEGTCEEEFQRAQIALGNE